MLKGKQIIIFSGDQRYIQVIKYLASKRADVFTIGCNSLQLSQTNIRHRNTFDEMDLTNIDAIILPVEGTNDEGQIKLHDSNQTVTLTKNAMKQTPTHCTIYSGTANDYLRNICTETNRKLITLFDRDDVAISNSIPTAEATLQIAMEKTDYTIHGSNVLITGFGRIGMTIARTFQLIGANVTVAARKTVDFARMKEMRMHPVHIYELEPIISEVDICINTVPYLVLTENLIKHMKTDCLIIDVASKPGGTDFKSAADYQIKTIHALGLPGKYAPKTAGNIIAQTIEILIVS